MQVIDPGHEYRLDSLDGEFEHYLVFVKREGELYPGNVGSHPGTTTQEVLRACVDRLLYVNNQLPCDETQAAAMYLRRAIWLLEVRAAARHGRQPPDYDKAIRGEGKCLICGHVGCEGDCHPAKKQAKE